MKTNHTRDTFLFFSPPRVSDVLKLWISKSGKIGLTVLPLYIILYFYYSSAPPFHEFLAGGCDVDEGRVEEEFPAGLPVKALRKKAELQPF